MDPTAIYVHGRGKSLEHLVSEYGSGNPSNRNRILCGIHLQLCEQHLEMRVQRSGVRHQLLAVTEDSAVDDVGITQNIRTSRENLRFLGVFFSLARCVFVRCDGSGKLSPPTLYMK